MESGTAIAAVFSPVQPPTTFEETVERLGRAIQLGLLEPGSQLPPERELAAQLGISRSTLRQALTTLVQSGHLRAQRGRAGGTFVAEHPPMSGAAVPSPDWQAVLDLRVAVEIGTVVLACERAGEGDLERLDGPLAAMDAALEDFEVYRRGDVLFHIGLAEATGSAALVAAMTEAQGAMTDLISYIAHPPEVLAWANAQHARLVDCLERRDPSGAMRIMADHLRGTEHVLAGLLP
jgi:GntR family transcriptional regulator, transcriptional repressor for pyruvate dehydrogenase complex